MSLLWAECLLQADDATEKPSQAGTWKPWALMSALLTSFWGEQEWHCSPLCALIFLAVGSSSLRFGRSLRGSLALNKEHISVLNSSRVTETLADLL